MEYGEWLHLDRIEPEWQPFADALSSPVTCLWPGNYAEGFRDGRFCHGCDYSLEINGIRLWLFDSDNNIDHGHYIDLIDEALEYERSEDADAERAMEMYARIEEELASDPMVRDAFLSQLLKEGKEGS